VAKTVRFKYIYVQWHLLIARNFLAIVWAHVFEVGVKILSLRQIPQAFTDSLKHIEREKKINDRFKT
jgi:hypothetical protein